MRPISSPFVIAVFFFTCLLRFSAADLGTAAHYGPPYLPTACNGYAGSQFPASGQFAAAGDAIWYNKATCGVQYVVRCVSGDACKPGRITVPIVDYAPTAVSPPSSSRATIVLSENAFAQIADLSKSIINIEFEQV